MITTELHAKVNATIQACFIKLLGRELDVAVTYRKDMKKTAGLAYTISRKIELNEILFLENVDEFFSRTIPHEAAHIITKILYPHAKQSHGPEWRYIMDRLEVSDIKRCHSYDVSSVAKPRLSEKFTYTCACKSFSLSKIMHNKIQKGSHRVCNSCKTRVVYQD